MSPHLTKYTSSIKGVEWPPIPTPMAAQLLTMLHSLEQSQWLSNEEIQAHQFKQLMQVVLHAKNTVPYYKATLSFLNANITPSELRKYWQELPLLTRQQLQHINNVSNAPFPDHGPSEMVSTSGSTGRPVWVRANAATQFFWNLFSLRDHNWHNRDFSKKLAIIDFSLDKAGDPPYGKHCANWSPATYHVTQTGECRQLNCCSIEEEVDWLKRVNPHYLLCFPSKLKELIQHMRERNIKLKCLKEVWTKSEIVEPNLRDLVQKELNVKLIDTYSSAEFGYIALQCPNYEHYHIQSENVYVEILDEKNNPCKPGEIGKVVITALHNFAAPLIRYEIGDYALVGEPCVCGRGLPVVKRIMGRQRNMLTLANGKKIWPGFGYFSYKSFFEKIQYQIIQHSTAELEVKLTCHPCTETVEAEVSSWIQEALGCYFNIRFTYVDEIPRSAGGKFEDFKSLIESYESAPQTA